MKLSQIYKRAVLFAFAGATAWAGDVTIGVATFGDQSDAAATGSYWSMPMEAVQTYNGFGDYEGFIRTRRCTKQETVAGVRCLKLSVGTGSGLEGVESLTEPDGELVTTSEAWWLAVDANGDVRVLKMTRGGVGVFEASPTVAPPVLFPASPTVNQSWEVLGKKITVAGVDVTAGGVENLLKLKIEAAVPAAPPGAPVGTPAGAPEPPAAPAAAVEFAYYKAGAGLVRAESSVSEAASGSGWAVKNP